MRAFVVLLSMMALASITGQTAHPSVSAETQAPPVTMAFRVLVTGEVRYPGRATLTEATMTVPDALAAVGSPTIDAGDHVIVIHPGLPGEAPQRRTIALTDVDQATRGIDLSLQDGDVVNVPLGPRFFVSGFVKRPGTYRLSPGTAVSQAIAMAGGLSDRGTDRRVRIRRMVNGKPVEIVAQPGDSVLPGDEVKVPSRMF
jgi:polysaccharide export outer membrane protein